MAVNAVHKQYADMQEKWKKCRVVVEGEDAVKAAGSLFLPMLSGQSGGEYAAYKMRALFYGATGRTLDGLLGAIFRREPVLTPAEGRVTEELKSVTQDYLTARDFATEAVFEVLALGRFGILVDAPQGGGTPYLAPYTAESIINWQTEATETGQKLTRVVLEEKYTTEGSDEFMPKDEIQYRVLEIVDSKYQQRVFRKSNVGTEDEGFVEISELTVWPTVAGAALDTIPFYFINPFNQSTTVFNPPLLSLVNVNLSHYRSSADLEHGRHFTGLPTAWVAGFTSNTLLHIGSSIAWVSEDPNAKAGFLEFTGQGLQSLENALKEKQDMMAVLGARMLEDPKKAVEAADTLETRYRGENSVLSTVSNTVSMVLSKVFTQLLAWRGVKKDVVYTLNKDFISSRLSFQEVQALMAAWQSGGMSWDVLFFNFQRGELYPEDMTKEEEANRIGTAPPPMALGKPQPGTGTGGGVDDEEDKEDGVINPS